MNKIEQLLEKFESYSLEFLEYSSEGYSGGKSGLRCSICDNKYSGEANIVQYCPRCKAKKILKIVIEKVIAEVLEDVVPEELDITKYNMDSNCEGNYVRGYRQRTNEILAKSLEWKK